MPTNQKEYMKTYYKTKRQQILDRMKETVMCDICNTYITRSNFAKHLESYKHTRLRNGENKKQINMLELTAKMDDLKILIEKVEKLTASNKPEAVLRRVFGSLGKSKKLYKDDISDVASSDTN